MAAVNIKNEIFMLHNLWAACSNVYGVVKSLLIIKHKKERKKESDTIIRFLLLELNKKRSKKKQSNISGEIIYLFLQLRSILLW